MNGSKLNSRGLQCVSFLVIAAWLAISVAAEIQVAPLNAPQAGQRVEFEITGVPAVANPYDPDLVRVDGVFTLPSGRTLSLPAFWFQDFTRKLANGAEVLTAKGAPGWRLRFTPPEAGAYQLVVSVTTNQTGAVGQGSAAFTAAATAPSAGFARVAASKQNFETQSGEPLRLVGHNVCWPGKRGGYDYDDWLPAMRAVGENFTRLWMWPLSFGLEVASNSLTRYAQGPAWQLDYVFGLAESNGIFIELCLDYHGMFVVQPDYWGGNNYWPANPYNVVNGGPCVNQNAFFTNAAAQTLYQKRLRYLVGRYGAYPNLFSWQFFNEIDNVYSLVNSNHVAAWHGVMGRWLRANDPYGHLITTSFASAATRPEMWGLPEMDYACPHSYGAGHPATAMRDILQAFRGFDKPVLMDEYGVSWQGWNRAQDPYLRGFRQGIWGGALGGGAGTSMSWWWENIHSENCYGVFRAFNDILGPTGWGIGGWTNLVFTTDTIPPNEVGEVIPGASPLAVALYPNPSWGSVLPGQLAVPNASAAQYASQQLDCFVHGSSHADLKSRFRLQAWFTNDARLVLHVNSVSSGAALIVRVDGAQQYRTNLANLDGGYSVNNEYNLDIPVPIPAGKHLVEIANGGADWYYLDWVRLEGVMPAQYRDNWQPTPEPIGLRGARESLVYLVAPDAAYTGNSTNATLPLQHAKTLSLPDWPPGKYVADWHDPATGKRVAQSLLAATNGALTLQLPDYTEDLAAVIYPLPALAPLSCEPGEGFKFRLTSETSGRYEIQKSNNLRDWTPLLSVTNRAGVSTNVDAAAASSPAATYYRALQIR